MKQLTINTIGLSMAIALLVRCNFDINTNPNDITDRTVNGEIIFPAAAESVGDRVASTDFEFLEGWLGYWSRGGGFVAEAAEITYQITPDFCDNIWTNGYSTLFNLEKARSKSLAMGDTSVAGASMILSAMLFQDMVDMFGNIPYSQAFQYATYPQPAFDKGQDVYNALQANLDIAIGYMSKPASVRFHDIDIVTKGNTTRWIQFANTLKLRLLIRQSEIPGFSATAEIAKINKNGAGFLGVGQTISENPEYVKVTNQQSPFYDNYGLSVDSQQQAAWVAPNSYFVGLLTEHDDPRLTRYFTTVSGKVVGAEYGLTVGPENTSVIGPGLARSADQDQWIFTAAESLFLQAEAAQRGWLSADAAALYKSAVTESFTFLGVPDAEAEATTYLTKNPFISGKIKNTLFQKYIAMCGIAPIEAWSDLRRIGFDIIPVQAGGYKYISSAVSPTTTVPIRLLYARTEYTNNFHTADEGAINQFTSKIFWDVK